MADLLGDMCVSWDFSLSDYKVVGLEVKSQETHMCSACALSLSNKRSTCHSLAVPAPYTVFFRGAECPYSFLGASCLFLPPQTIFMGAERPNRFVRKAPQCSSELSIAPILRNPLDLNCWHEIAERFDGKPSLRHVCFLGFQFEREVLAPPVSLHRKPFLLWERTGPPQWLLWELSAPTLSWEPPA